MRAVCAAAILWALFLTGCSSLRIPAVPANGAAFATRSAQPSREIVLLTFASPTYGNSLPSPLTPDGAGNYFGTTSVGGLGYGTLYELSPNHTGGWHETVLHTFADYLDGGFPEFTPLVFDKNGDLYGTTQNGGINGVGVAFRFHRAASGWNETVLHNFGSGDAYPFNSLILDSPGNLYGTDNVYHDGGGSTEGVYEIRASGAYKIIYDLGMPAANGASGGLVMDTNGNIFGLSSGFIEPAVVFELKRSGAGCSPSILFRFKAVALYPLGAPVLDAAGNIYGTTADGGSEKHGTVYELLPSKTGPWKMKTLYAFKGGAYGAGPYAGIVFDSSGNIYGTALGGASHSGVVYELTAGSYDERVLWTFNGKDGNKPLTPLVLDDAGNLFGTTSTGGGDKRCVGAAGCGNAFEVTH